MHDLNFFINLNAKKQRTPVLKYLLVALLAVLIAFAGLYAFMQSQINQVQSDVSQLNAELNDPKVKAAKLEVQKQERQLSILNQYDAALVDIESYLEQQDRIGREELDTILASIPLDVTVMDMVIDREGLTIDAYTANDLAKAQFINNLKQTDLFASVELQNVQRDYLTISNTNNRTLVYQCLFKEVQSK